MEGTGFLFVKGTLCLGNLMGLKKTMPGKDSPSGSIPVAETKAGGHEAPPVFVAG
jgi:hypothetical protein